MSYEVNWNNFRDYIYSSEAICMYVEDQTFQFSVKMKQPICWDMKVFGLMHFQCI